MPKYNTNNVMKQIERDVMRVVRKAPRAVGRIAVNHFEENFERGGFMDKSLERWEPRKNDKDPGRGVLIGKQSASLMRSIRVISTTGQAEIVGTSKPYARIHNRGGTINHPGGTAYFVRNRKAHFVRNVTAKRYNQIFNKELPRTKPHKIRIPQRKFLGPSHTLNLRIARWYIRQFNKNLK
jgi:phage gpG-like protein